MMRCELPNQNTCFGKDMPATPGTARPKRSQIMELMSSGSLGPPLALPSGSREGHHGHRHLRCECERNAVLSE